MSKPIEERLYIREGIWCLRPYRISTGFPEAQRDQAIARAIEIERERSLAPLDVAKAKAKALEQARQRMTVKDAIGQVHDHDTRQNARPKTRSYHKERGQSLLRSPEDGGLGAESRLVDIINKPDLLKYFTKRLEGATLKQRHTVQKDYKMLRLSLRLCQEMGLWEGNLSVCEFDFFKKASKFYAPGETWLEEIEYIDALIEEVSSGRSQVRRVKRNRTGKEWTNRAPVRVNRKLHALTLVRQGLRHSEVHTIYPHHVNLVNRGVAVNYPKDAVPDDAEIRKGKTIEAKRVFPLDDIMVEAYRHKLKDCDPTTPLFEPWPSARRDINAAWKRARRTLIQRRLDSNDKRGADHLNMILPRSLCLNDLRRTFCSQMAKAGVPLQTCADLMGHTDDTMVKLVYRRCAPAQLQAAVAMLPPMALPVPQPLPSAAPQTDPRDFSNDNQPAQSEATL